MDDELVIRAAIRDELTGPLRDIRDELRGTARDAGNAGAKANIGARGFDKMASGAGRFVKAGIGVAARAAATGIVALTTATVVGSIKLLSLASDAAETASAFKTVFKGVPGQVGGYLKKLNREFGITTAELQRAATTFGVFGKAAGIPKKELGGFTKDLTKAGLDLSSFYNADPSEVFLALKSGLAGEAEPLRQFGIFLSDAMMKAEAASMGLNGELTEGQKVAVRQRIIMKSLGDAEGDLARTKDGLANKTKALKGRLNELGTELGDRLRPHAEKAAAALDGRLKGALDNLDPMLDRIERKAGKLFRGWQRNGVDGVVNTIDRMTDQGGDLSSKWDKVKSVADDVATIVSKALAPALGDASTATLGLSSPLVILDNVLSFLADHTTATRAALTLLVVGLTVAKVATLGMAAASKLSLIWLKAHTAGTKTHMIVSKTAAAASAAWTGAQWLLNAALSANPIGLVVIAIGLLVAGLVIGYKKSALVREGLLRMAQFGVFAFKWLVTAAIKTFEGILWAADKGLGWVPGLGDKIKGAREAFGEFGDATIAKLDRLENKLKASADAADEVAKDRSATITVATVYTSRNKAKERQLDYTGDTRTRRRRGPGSLVNTLGAHHRAQAATGAKLTITNALIGGGGRGRGSGDHQAGRALDVKGQGIAAYGRHIRAEGGYFAMHGAGNSRHGHAVPAAGDTIHSKARPSSPSSGSSGGITIEAGAVQVRVENPTSNVDVEVAVKDALEAWIAEREERA